MAETIGAALERNAELADGARLVARYKGEDYQATVVAGPPLRIQVGGDELRSLSEAAKAVCGGTSVNGWRFWRLAPQSATPAAPAKRGRGRPRKVQTPVGGDDGATCAGSAGVERRTLEESLSSAPGGSDEQVDRLFCESCGAQASNYAEALEHAADAGHPFEVPPTAEQSPASE